MRTQLRTAAHRGICTKVHSRQLTENIKSVKLTATTGSLSPEVALDGVKTFRFRPMRRPHENSMWYIEIWVPYNLR